MSDRLNRHNLILKQVSRGVAVVFVVCESKAVDQDDLLKDQMLEELDDLTLGENINKMKMKWGLTHRYRIYNVDAWEGFRVEIMFEQDNIH